jgi:hypothetical protein
VRRRRDVGWIRPSRRYAERPALSTRPFSCIFPEVVPILQCVKGLNQMNVSFECTGDDWRKASRAVWERMPTSKQVLHFERFVLTCVALLLGFSVGRPIGGWVALPVALAVFLVYPYWLKYLLGRRVIRTLTEARGTPPDGIEEYSIGERGMTNRSIIGDTTIAWWACKGASLYRGDVYVDTLRGAYRVAGRAFGSENELRTFVAFVNDHKGFGSATDPDVAQ